MIKTISKQDLYAEVENTANKLIEMFDKAYLLDDPDGINFQEIESQFNALFEFQWNKSHLNIFEQIINSLYNLLNKHSPTLVRYFYENTWQKLCLKMQKYVSDSELKQKIAYIFWIFVRGYRIDQRNVNSFVKQFPNEAVKLVLDEEILESKIENYESEYWNRLNALRNPGYIARISQHNRSTIPTYYSDHYTRAILIALDKLKQFDHLETVIKYLVSFVNSKGKQTHPTLANLVVHLQLNYQSSWDIFAKYNIQLQNKSTEESNRIIEQNKNDLEPAVRGFLTIKNLSYNDLSILKSTIEQCIEQSRFDLSDSLLKQFAGQLIVRREHRLLKMMIHSDLSSELIEWLNTQTLFKSVYARLIAVMLPRLK